MYRSSCKTGPSVFLCHAGEDKDKFVEPLYKALIANGLKAEEIFYDKFSIPAGQDIKRYIESAIANPNLRLVVVVLSRKLLCEHKQWPKRECELALQNRKEIFQIWLDDNFDYDFNTLVGKYSPTLKGIRAHCVTCDGQTGIVDNKNIRDVATKIISELANTTKRSTLYAGCGLLAMVVVTPVIAALLHIMLPRDDPDILSTTAFLKNLYGRRYSYTQPLPWKPGLRLGLADGYINPRMQKEDGRGLFSTPAEVFTISQLFNSHERSDEGNELNPIRIAVEAEPGGGKSTLCRKVVIDWVEDRITSFTLVFLVDLRHFNGSVMDSIYDQLLGDNVDISKTVLKEYIKHHQEKVCFILDGFDELRAEYQKKSEILELMKGEIFYGSTVLVTSRPSRFAKVHKGFDAFYKIVGFRQDQTRKIFRGYFINDSKSAAELSETVSNNHYLKEITENPLYALLICVLWEDNRQRLPETKTQLYEEMVISITRRYCDKFDIEYDGRSFPAHIERLLLSQGRLAWEGSEINKLDFDLGAGEKENSKRTEMLSLGMMVQRETDSRTSGYTYVAFLHPTFQEFMAAYYIRNMVYNEENSFPEILNTIVRREDLEGILIFLCGLSGDQAGPLLTGFKDAISENVTTDNNRSLVRRCLACLGATNAGDRLSGIVAPAMPEEVVCDFDYQSVEWVAGFTGFIKFLQMNSDDFLRKTFRSLVLASIHGARVLTADMLTRIKGVLQTTTVVESLKVAGWCIPLLSRDDTAVLTSPLRDFFPDDSLRKIDITVVSADFKDSTANVTSSIKCMKLTHILEDLRKKRNVNEIRIFAFSASATSYCDAIRLLLQSQTSLKSFTLDVTAFHGDTRGCQDFHVLLDAMKNHGSINVVSLTQPAQAIFPESTLVHNSSTMLISIARCIRESRIVKSFVFNIWDCASSCSMFALMKLSEAIRSNRVLEELVIVGIPLENESDQDAIYDIMRNKPSTMKTLELRMRTYSAFDRLLESRKVT